jgi:purine-nucleoside phosphorylase
MEGCKRKAAKAADFVRRVSGAEPGTGIMAGTGLGGLTEGLRVLAAVEYAEIPHFPVATAPAHAGRVVIGEAGGKTVLVMLGRFHLYEGYSPAEVAFPVRVMQELGIRRLVVTNAAGGLNPAFGPGEMMLIADHINLTGENPLVGANEDGWGVRFPDMGRAYDPALAALAAAAAAAAGTRLHRGVYAGLKGPSLETPAEIRFLKTIGADAVGLSTVMEVIAAIHAGMHVLGISIISNVNDPDRPVPATLAEIVAVANQATPQLVKLLHAIIERVDHDEHG